MTYLGLSKVSEPEPEPEPNLDTKAGVIKALRRRCKAFWTQLRAFAEWKNLPDSAFAWLLWSVETWLLKTMHAEVPDSRKHTTCSKKLTYILAMYTTLTSVFASARYSAGTLQSQHWQLTFNAPMF